jgi:hypothetical protein
VVALERRLNGLCSSARRSFFHTNASRNDTPKVVLSPLVQGGVERSIILEADKEISGAQVRTPQSSAVRGGSYERKAIAQRLGLRP